MMTLLSRGRSVHPHNGSARRQGCGLEFPNIGARRLEHVYECGSSAEAGSLSSPHGDDRGSLDLPPTSPRVRVRTRAAASSDRPSP